MTGDLPNARQTVLLIDDAEMQSVRIQERLLPHGIGVQWCRSYRDAAELLRDPDLGQLVDCILIDQAFDEPAVVPEDLLTHSEIDQLTGALEWDVRLHQGLFVMARLSQDMREGLIPFTPMMILTHHGRVELAAQVGLGGYESKRRLLTDPYSALKGYLAQMRPAPADVEARVQQLQNLLGLGDELASQVRRHIAAGLDLEETCATVARLEAPNDWTLLGRALTRLNEQRTTFSADRLATAVGGAWLASPDGWLHVSHVELLGPLGDGFEAFRVEIGRPGATFPALLAARALAPEEAPGAADLRRSFRLLREIDGRSHPIRLRDGVWTIVGCWLHEPASAGQGAGAVARRLVTLTRHVGELHRRGLAHGSLSALSAGFESPAFGGIRCLTGGVDLADLRRADLTVLPSLGWAAFGDAPADDTREALECWAAAARRGELDVAERELRSAGLRGDPPAYYEFDRLCSGGEAIFRDLLLASLGSDDAVLREVRCEEVSTSPVDFVVCAKGAIAVLEHRTWLSRVVIRDGRIAEVETEQRGPEGERCRRSLARCERSADVLAGRIESAMALAHGSIRRLSAVVVTDLTVVDAPEGSTWRPVVTEAEAITELIRLSRAGGGPRGVDMAEFVPGLAAMTDSRPARRRALRWTAMSLGADLTRMRTWRKQWSADAWHRLLGDLAVARTALRPLEGRSQPLPLVRLRSYDDDGEPCDIAVDAVEVDMVEYDVTVPETAVPLAGYFGEPGGEAGRRRLGASVLRSLLTWGRCRLAYGAMHPDGLVHAGGRVHCDLLHHVTVLDPEARWRQRCGAAASLVFLLSPWPYAWPAVVTGTMPPLHQRPGERSAWGIAAEAVAALLDRSMEPRRLEVLLEENAALLEAAALLDRRFPAWPAGLSRDAQL